MMDLILWEKHKSVEVRTRVRLEGEFQGQTNPHRIGVAKAVEPDPPQTQPAGLLA